MEAVKADSIRVASTLTQIDADLDLLLAELDVLKIHDQLFEIYFGQYQANEISTEEYLRRKIQIQRVKSTYQRKLQRLHLRAIENDYPAIKILDSLLLLKNFGFGQRPISFKKKDLKPKFLFLKRQSCERSSGIASVIGCASALPIPKYTKLCLM